MFFETSFFSKSRGNGGLFLVVRPNFFSQNEIKSYYDSLSLSDICGYWDWAWDSGRKRGFVKQSLKRRGVNPNYCYNPELDALKQIQHNIDKDTTLSIKEKFPVF